MDPAERLERCRRRWSLPIGDRLAGGFRSEVYAAGADRVVKLGASASESRLEAAALRVWAGSGASVGLVDVDPGTDALLLERLRPGTPMPRGEPGALPVLGGLLNLLHGCPLPPGHPFPTFGAVLPRLERVALADLSYERRTRGEPSRAEAGLRLVPAARRLLRRLSDPDRGAVLQHGDPLTKNLLADDGAPLGYRLIDPMPRTGDPAADVGLFAQDQPAPMITDTAADLARLTGLDPDRCVAWAVGWTVLLVVQAWRDDQPELEALLSTPIFTRHLPSG